MTDLDVIQRLPWMGGPDSNTAQVPEAEMPPKPTAAPATPAPVPRPVVEPDPDDDTGDGEPETEDPGESGLSRWWSRRTSTTDEPQLAPPVPVAPAAPARPPRWQPQHWADGMGPRRAARWRWTLYNGSAALLGNGVGLQALYGGAITLCGQQTNPVAALVLAVGMCAVTWHFLDRRTRGWWPPLAWALRAPLASACLAIALYPAHI